MIDVHYSHGDVALTGLRLSSTGAGAVLLIHGGAGLDSHAREQAHRFAARGYTVFACDMYGDEVAADRQQIIAAATQLRDDPDLLVQRAAAWLAQLRVDGPVSAIGYCFGGSLLVGVSSISVKLNRVSSLA